jgi:hypothetical protein
VPRGPLACMGVYSLVPQPLACVPLIHLSQLGNGENVAEMCECAHPGPTLSARALHTSVAPKRVVKAKAHVAVEVSAHAQHGLLHHRLRRRRRVCTMARHLRRRRLPCACCA